MNTKEPKSADEHRLSDLGSSMNTVQVEQKSYEMPPRDGISIAHFLTVADIDRSARFYEKVFDGRILSKGDSDGAPAYIQIANTRPDPRQADSNAQRPRSGEDQQLYEYPRSGYSSLQQIMEKS